jgi:hypothetical protein
MISEELIAYVKEQRQAGVSDQAIREAILSVGWGQQDADEALVASAVQTADTPTLSGTPEEPDQAHTPQESTPQEPALETDSQEAITQEPAEEPKKTLPEQQEPHQQEDYLASSLEEPEEPIATLEQETASAQEETTPEETKTEPISEEEPLSSLDSQPGPIELDDQGRPVTKEAQQEVVQEQPLRTENDLAKPVSFSPTDQEPEPVSETPRQQEPSPVEESTLNPEPVANQPTSQEPVPSQEPSLVQKPPTTPQEASSQVAIDPKAQDK